MALISLGTVTIVAMSLWVLISVISLAKPVKHAKGGVAVMYLVAVYWALGVPI